MAIFNGTQAADTISGTVDDDLITGLGGNDIINGAAGDDLIFGDEGSDNIIGGAGNDTITGGAGRDTLDGGEGDDTFIVNSAEEIEDYTGGWPYYTTYREDIDGGEGSDTLVTSLLDGDDLNNSAYSTSTVWGESVNLSNMEFVTVSNASDFTLDLASDASFGMDETITSQDGVSQQETLDVLNYDASNGDIDQINADRTSGVVIGGVTYLAGQTYVATDGGTVDITFNNTPGMGGVWEFDYTPAAENGYVVGDASISEDDVIEENLVVTVTDINGDQVTVSVDLATNYDADFDATLAHAGVNSNGDFQDNIMTGSAFDDTIWAGSDDGESSDTLNGLAGDDILAGGGGADTLDGGDGNDTLYTGSGDDFAYGGNGDDKIFGADGDDTLRGENGNDTIYGGDGADDVQAGSGDDTIYGGAGDGDILRGGTGNDTIFNGAGDDRASGDAGDDVLWGGAGNDVLWGDAGADTFAFAAGNGNDVIRDFDFDEGDMLDLQELGFADTQAVLDNMSNVGGTAVLAVAPGQTVTFDGHTVNDFQTAADDWVLV